MANNLEGGGRTPLLSPGELQDLGFGIVAYPLSLLGTAAAAMQSALRTLRAGRVPSEDVLPSFQVRGAVCRCQAWCRDVVVIQIASTLLTHSVQFWPLHMHARVMWVHIALLSMTC